MLTDDIHAMSEMLAADPSSLVFLPLGEALLARGDLVHAAHVAQRGAVRHAARLDAHDLVARIALAQGDETRAEAAWRHVLRVEPAFGTAHRGLGLVCYRQGRLDEAREHLSRASHEDPGDTTVQVALAAVRSVILARDQSERASGAVAAERATGGVAGGRDSGAAAGSAPAVFAFDDADAPAHPGDHHEAMVEIGDSAARLFDTVLDDARQVALLLDGDGLVVAGQYFTASGSDLGMEIGAHLAGVGDEAERAMRHFQLGRWTRLVIESEAATLTMVPEGTSTVLVVAPRDVPLGFVRRTLDRCVAVTRAWIGEGA